MGDVNMFGRGVLNDFAGLAMDVAYSARVGLEKTVFPVARVMVAPFVGIGYLADVYCYRSDLYSKQKSEEDDR